MRKATIEHDSVKYSMTDKSFVYNYYNWCGHTNRERITLDEELKQTLTDAFSKASGVELWENVNRIWNEARQTHRLA
jgi:hypothetical protein